MKNMLQRYNMLHYYPNKNTKRQYYFTRFDIIIYITILFKRKTGATLPDYAHLYQLAID